MKVTLDLPDAAVRVEAPRPLRVSQKTCKAVLGLESRQFLEALPAFEASGGEVLRLGRMRLVDPDAFLRWLAARDVKPEKTADDLEARLAGELGLRAIGGGRR